MIEVRGSIDIKRSMLFFIVVLENYVNIEEASAIKRTHMEMVRAC
jgi:hypothetical protein